MKTKRLISIALVAVLAAACAIFMVACGSSKLTGGVAATVNGKEIAEDKVTEYIEDIRTSYDLTKDSDWATYLAMYGMTPATLREEVINMFVEDEAVKIAAEQRGIKVEASEVDEAVNSMKENFDSEEEWKDALKSADFTEESYREEVEGSLLYEKLEESVTKEIGGDGEITDEKRLEYAQAYAEAFDGARKSSHILFATGDETKAQEVLDQIKGGSLDFVEAVKEYSIDTVSAADEGNVGWDCLESLDDNYQVALEELDKDQVSDLVTSEFGVHIIKCTDVFKLDGELASIDDLPDEIKAYVEELIETESASDDFAEWLSTYVEGLDVVINEIPAKVPYNVDMSSATASLNADELAVDESDVEVEADGAETDAEGADEAADENAEKAEGDANAEKAEGEASPSAASAN